MNLFHKTALSILIGLGSVLAFAPQANAGWEFQALKPDLRLYSVKPSTVGPNYVRVVITNNGVVASAPCYVRIKINANTPIYAYHWISSMPPSSGMGINVYTGYSPLAKPGMVTQAVVDVYGQVSETNESNNTAYFIAPPG